MKFATAHSRVGTYGMVLLLFLLYAVPTSAFWVCGLPYEVRHHLRGGSFKRTGQIIRGHGHYFSVLSACVQGFVDCEVNSSVAIPSFRGFDIEASCLINQSYL